MKYRSATAPFVALIFQVSDSYMLKFVSSIRVIFNFVESCFSSLQNIVDSQNIQNLETIESGKN